MVKQFEIRPDICKCGRPGVNEPPRLFSSTFVETWPSGRLAVEAIHNLINLSPQRFNFGLLLPGAAKIRGVRSRVKNRLGPDAH